MNSMIVGIFLAFGGYIGSSIEGYHPKLKVYGKEVIQSRSIAGE